MHINMLPAEKRRRAAARKARWRAEQKSDRALEAALGVPPMWLSTKPRSAPPDEWIANCPECDAEIKATFLARTMRRVTPE